MKIQSLQELLEVYDYTREHCKEDPLFENVKILRRWLQEAALMQAIWVQRSGSKIDGVAFVWPTHEIPIKGETPFYNAEGEILWCQYCYASDRKRGNGKVMAYFLNEMMAEFPFIKKLCYRRTKKGNRIYTWPLRGREEAPEELEAITNGQ